jgi:predicted O-methyltransferase YrrM
VLEVTGASPDEYAAAVAEAWRPEPADDEGDWRSRTVLFDILAAIVTLQRPSTVVEIGIERGYSSAVMLAAMSARGTGRLHSIDLPRLGKGDDFIGQAVPSELHDRWERMLGPSRHRLPELLRRVEQVDLFLHDGDHSYQSQFEDLSAVWPRLSQGGTVVVDDVWTSAIVDFASEVGTHPLLIERWDEHDAIGLLRKG